MTTLLRQVGLITILVLPGLLCQADSNQTAQLFQSHLKATLKGLETLRARTGLIQDQQRYNPFGILESKTTPAHIALDLLVQLEADDWGKVAKILKAVRRLPHHEDTGLFYSGYTTDLIPRVSDRSLSSVQNLYLALALWTASEYLSVLATPADRLFQKMDFSIFFDLASKSISSKLRYDKGKWIPQGPQISNLRSEGRMLYGVGGALGLFRKIRNADLTQSFATLKGRISQARDGEALQLLLPRLLVGEDQYSEKWRQVFQDYTRKTLAEKDQVLNPHLLFLTASTDPEGLIKPLSDARNLGEKALPFFDPSRGWLDAYIIKDTGKGQVVPTQSALNLEVTALALFQILSSHRSSLSARMLWGTPPVRAKLTEFYKGVSFK